MGSPLFVRDQARAASVVAVERVRALAEEMRDGLAATFVAAEGGTTTTGGPLKKSGGGDDAEDGDYDDGGKKLLRRRSVKASRSKKRRRPKKQQARRREQCRTAAINISKMTSPKMCAREKIMKKATPE